MDTRRLLIGSVLLSLAAGLSEAAPPRTKAKPTGPALKAVRKALEDGPKQGAEDAVALYREAAAQAVRLAPANLFVKEELEKALARARAETDVKEAGRVLREALREAEAVLAFTPRMEAQLPERWPEVTPVGEVRLKHYPAYRLARTKSASNTAAFFTLFNHISKNAVEMTAPVEMTFESDKRGKLKQKDMAFLFGSPQTGKTGKNEGVEVLDLPAMDAVSIGLRGEENRESLAEARTRLERWLEQHADEYQACGPLRVMGYNSPAVPAGERYYEVEIPVRSRKGSR